MKGAMIKTHYLPMFEPDPFYPRLIGYNVWAYIGHPLLGEIKGTHQFAETKSQAQRIARKTREKFNGGVKS